MKDIRKVLSSYKQRFISTSPRSRTYFLSVLDDKSAIDITKFNEQFGISDEILPKLLNGEELVFKKKKIDLNLVKKLLLENNEYSKRKVKEYIPIFTNKDFQELDEMTKVLSLLKTEFDELDDLENKTRQSYIKSQITKLQRDLNDFALELIDHYTRMINKNFTKIESLENRASTMMKDFGKNDLYLGYPFIEGKFQTGKYFRAPLILHRVEFKKVTNKLSFKIVEGESIINPVFLITYHVENNLTHQMFDWSLKDKDFISEAYNLLDKFKISYQKLPKTLSSFKSKTRKEFMEENIFDYNQFATKNNLIIGLFPISDKNIYDDLVDLENSEFTENDSITTFIKGIENLDEIFVNKPEERVKESEIKYITHLDYSQKNVVKEALKNNLVIEGPPGTGKSQVLSNIVANYVEKGKKVLVVSEKLAALEVVYNRIGNLSANALLIRNHVSDKDSFYKQLKNAINQIKTEGTKDTYRPFTEIDNEVESLFSKLENRESAYQKEYANFTYEDIVRYSSSSTKEIKNLKKIVNKKLKNNTKREVMDSLQSKIESIFEKGLNKTAAELTEFSSKTQSLKINDIKLYTKYLLTYKDYPIEARELLFYVIMKGLNIDLLVDTVDSRFNEVKTYDLLKEDLKNFIDSGSSKRYLNHLKEINNVVYDYLGINSETINFISNYRDLSTKDKVVFIKQIKKRKYSLSFLKSFKPTNALNKKEKEVYLYLEKEFIFMKPETVMTHGLTTENESILKLISRNPDLSIDDLTVKAFNEGIFTIDLGKLKATLNAVHKYHGELNDDTLESVMKNSKIMMDLALAIHNDGLKTLEGSIHALGKYLVRKEFALLKSEIDFYDDFDSKYKNTIKTLDDKMHKSRISIENNLKRDISVKGQTNVEFAKAIAELRRISDLKRKKSIAVTTKRFTHEILELFPICLMTPGSVSATLKNDKNLFDVVIFDEASQMFVEHAVPSINRSKTIIVAGDSKQLKPSSIFSQRFIEGDELWDEEYSFDVIAALDEESLLDYCKHKYKSVDLRYHYRSDHKELIEFSSRAFYDSKLVFSSNVINEEKKPIEVIDVEGKWLNNKNRDEAIKVVELVKEILLTRKNNETIGVITFNSKQMDIIQDLLEDESQTNKELTKELSRVNLETFADESLFVKNIENVQGDERDIIIFSVAYAFNRKGKFNNIFGSLSQPGGENRLNVAITRAKKKVYIVKSINSSVLNVNDENKGNYFFKKYLQYTERIHNGEDVKAFLDGLSEIKASDYSDDFDTPFETEVFNSLKTNLDERYEVRNQIKVGSFNIDVAIYDNTRNKYILGIECDGAKYYGSKDAVERDIYRQTFLESRGWNVYKVWSTSWWNNKRREIRKIVKLVLENQ